MISEELYKCLTCNNTDHCNADGFCRHCGGSNLQYVGTDESILDDAEREMFGEEAEFLPDDMGAK